MHVTNKGKIHVSTIHRAKHCEFDYVFITGCNDENFPGMFLHKRLGNGHTFKIMTVRNFREFSRNENE
jgi:superfamily I DNA/RNA helicase